MSKSLAAVALATLLLASASGAEEADFGRPGWYLGVGGGGSWDFVDDALQDATNGAIGITSAGTFNARGGYRLTSWFALEGMYEGIYGYETEVNGVKQGNLDTHSLLVNLKLIVPTWRIQPYLVVGPGGQYGSFEGSGVLSALDTSRWDFVLRAGVGIDGYLTEHLLLNVELAPSIRFTDWIRATESTDNVAMTLSFGGQYRF
jgi:opacity protein-like surface antigen